MDDMEDSGGDQQAISYIRSQWVKRQMKDRSADFTERSRIRVFCGTWNVNGKKCDPAEPLAPWTRAWAAAGDGGPPALAVFGFQEMVDLNAANAVVDTKSAQRSDFWKEKLEASINEGEAKYVFVAEDHLVGVMVCVFARADALPLVTAVQTAHAAVGIMGVIGNKGGCSIRLLYQDTPLCFTCAHMAAHRENVAGRNADFANINSKTAFAVPDPSLLDDSGAPSSAGGGDGAPSALGVTQAGEVPRIGDHDVVFWMGDLNYRVGGHDSAEAVVAKVANDDLAPLLALDQLNVERAGRRVFGGYQEGAIAFKPTYKYQPGTSRYEQREGKKLRAPAWCDRVLWLEKDKATSAVAQLQYTSIDALSCSDHKPVSAVFDLSAERVVAAKRRAVLDSVIKKLDKWENDARPILELSSAKVDLGAVRYMQESKRTLTLTNTGQTPAQWRFMPKPDETELCKPWLRLEPTYGMLLPGETGTIDVTAAVDLRAARQLSAGSEVLSDLLVLHIERGADKFVDLEGSYARSCFGMPLDELCLVHGPIRDAPLDEPYAPPPGGAAAGPLAVPKELWRLVDRLAAGGLKAPLLFTAGGLEAEVDLIREALDTGADLPAVGACAEESVAAALVSFLASLPEPVVPRRHLPTIELDATNLTPWSRAFLEKLPAVNYNAFVYLCSFFREVLANKKHNLHEADQIASVCCQCMCVGEAAEKGKEGGAAPAMGGADGADDDGAADEKRAEKLALRGAGADMVGVLAHFLTAEAL